MTKDEKIEQLVQVLEDLPYDALLDLAQEMRRHVLKGASRAEIDSLYAGEVESKTVGRPHQPEREDDP